MKLSIVIPVFNNGHFTKSCLEDLSFLPKDHEVLVIDNGSTDNTKEIASKFNIKYFNLGKNTGFAHAVNFGYKESVGENVMFLNNDIRVLKNKENWTNEILDKCNEKTIVGPTIGKLSKKLNFIKEDNKIENDDCYYYMSGWNLTANKKELGKLIINDYNGPFTEVYTTYFEDADLSFRALEKDWKLQIVNVPVIHIGKATSSKLGISNLYLSAKSKFIKNWDHYIV